jgi:Uma2 family endonuclease
VNRRNLPSFHHRGEVLALRTLLPCPCHAAVSMLYSESMSHTPAEGPRRHRLTVADYYRMGEAGILAPDARVELIDGEIIDMAPIGSPHVSAVLQLDYLMKEAVAEKALVLVQGPIVLGEYSAPQPDLAVLRQRADYYRSTLAGPADVLLVVEVAQSSLRFDRDDKIPLYARHGIPEVWLIDLKAKRFVRYRNPQQGAYMSVDQPDLGSPLEIAALPESRLDLSALLS